MQDSPLKGGCEKIKRPRCPRPNEGKGLGVRGTVHAASSPEERPKKRSPDAERQAHAVTARQSPSPPGPEAVKKFQIPCRERSPQRSPLPWGTDVKWLGASTRNGTASVPCETLIFSQLPSPALRRGEPRSNSPCWLAQGNAYHDSPRLQSLLEFESSISPTLIRLECEISIQCSRGSL
jgi:hypothetical protein